jgi:HEAT repeat protein
MFRSAVARALLTLLVPSLPAQGVRFLGPGDPEPLPIAVPTPEPNRRGGIVLEADLTRFEFFWEIRQDAWLPARATRTPLDDELVLGRIVPALRRELATAESPDRVAAAMLALARLDPGADLAADLRARARDPHPQIRNSAYVALGIRASPDALGLLTSDARLAATESERVAAVWGLGQLAARTPLDTTRRAALTSLRALATDRSFGEPGRIAAVWGLGGGSVGTAARTAAVEVLDAVWRDPDAPVLLRAQVPPLAAAMTPDRTGREHRAAEWLAVACDPDAAPALRHAVLCGLGAALAGTGDRAAIGELAGRLRGEPGLRGATAIAVARIGGADARSALLDLLRTGSKALDVPWAALGLGILEHERRRSGAPPDRVVAEALRTRLADVKIPDTLSALALALALAGDRDACTPLADLLHENRSRDSLAGALGLALALLEPQNAEPLVLPLFEQSTRRPERRRPLATALGQIGSPAAVDALLENFGSLGNHVHSIAAEARALGATRSARAVEPLLAILADDESPDILRAHAAIALGLLADPRPEPWNAALLARVPWRAFPASAFAFRTGILTWL